MEKSKKKTKRMKEFVKKCKNDIKIDLIPFNSLIFKKLEMTGGKNKIINYNTEQSQNIRLLNLH